MSTTSSIRTEDNKYFNAALTKLREAYALLERVGSSSLIPVEEMAFKSLLTDVQSSMENLSYILAPTDAINQDEAQAMLNLHPDASPYLDSQEGQDVLKISKALGLKATNTNSER